VLPNQPIADGWENKSVNDLLIEGVILEIQDGNHGELHPKQKDFTRVGIPYITANCIVENRLEFDRCQYLPEKWLNILRIGFAKANDVILTHKGTVGATAIVPRDRTVLFLSPQTTYYRLSNRLLPQFLYYIFQSSSLQNQLFRIGKQSTRDYIGITAQRKLIIPYTNIIKQQRISNILTTVDGLIIKTDQIVKQTQKLKKGLMQRVLTKGIGHTEFIRIRFGSNYVLFPKEWSISTLKECTSKIGSGITPRGGSKVYLREGIPLIRSQNVHFYGLRLEDVAYISQEIHNEMKNSRVQEGDVLLNITGASLGRCTFVPTGFGEANVNQHVCIIRHNDRMDTIYLSLFLSSRLGQDMIFRVNHGLSREALNYQQIAAFQVPVPSIKEQRSIAVIMSRINRKIRRAEQFKIGVKDIKKGLLRLLLTGKIGFKI
jgi:type I restriction enzyme, S subunit